MTITHKPSNPIAKTGRSFFVPHLFKKWDYRSPDGKYLIPYQVQPQWAKQKIERNKTETTAEKLLIKAMHRLESKSSLKFVERTDERYLYFTHGENCSSHVGQMFTTGPQDVILGDGCVFYHTILHEVNYDNGIHDKTFSTLLYRIYLEYNITDKRGEKLI